MGEREKKREEEDSEDSEEQGGAEFVERARDAIEKDEIESKGGDDGNEGEVLVHRKNGGV